MNQSRSFTKRNNGGAGTHTLTYAEQDMVCQKIGAFEKFKDIEKQLPKRWEDLDYIYGYFVNSNSTIECRKNKLVGTINRF